LPATAGFDPSVVYHVSATPEPPASLAVSVTDTSAFWNVADTSSVVAGATLSTFAAPEAWTASALPALSSE
jgi:hypothetical protein